MNSRKERPRPQACLTIAGSDSGGGAGIQADLKAFQANGVYGMSVLTSVTAQNTQRVARAHDLPEDLILAQLQAIFDDFPVAAAKTGMLSSKSIVSTITAFWRSLGPAAPPLVVDPVMISKSGYPLLQLDAVARVRKELLPLATIVTPNRHEAELLSGVSLAGREDIEAAGWKILALGPRAVLLKGGHLDGPGLDGSRATDFLFAGGTVEEFSSRRIETTSTHGTGCTYSAAICAWLGRGFSIPESVARAKKYIQRAIQHGFPIGQGNGPTNHFFFMTDWMHALSRPVAGNASKPRARTTSPRSKRPTTGGKATPARPGTPRPGIRKAAAGAPVTTPRTPARKPARTHARTPARPTTRPPTRTTARPPARAAAGTLTRTKARAPARTPRRPAAAPKRPKAPRAR